MASQLKNDSLKSLMDWDQGIVSREIFVNREIYDQEQEQIFARSWLFVGHESQVAKPGDFFLSSMGEESVILTRDREHRLHVFLNTCRHRGMKVCRYDEGNTSVFSCPYHGWSYALDGKLVGVPYYQEAYGDVLDKSKWGLVEVAQLCNYKGTIWATWDPQAPSFLDYLGDMRLYLDAVVDGRDGREGGSEVFVGVWKWQFPANWKFGAENFLGDHAHFISHRSETLVGTGPGGPGTERHGSGAQRRTAPDSGNVSFTYLGHGSGGGAPRLGGTSRFPDFPNNPAVAEYFRNLAAERSERLGNKLYAPASTGTIFPNVSFHGWFPRGFAVWQPRSPQLTEGWRWVLIDSDAPDEVKDLIRHYATWYAGPQGMTEQDDMENWNYATEASSGVIARRLSYNYQMGMGRAEPVEGLKDALFTPFMSETNPVWYYRRWLELMGADSWNDLYPKKKDPVQYPPIS